MATMTEERICKHCQKKIKHNHFCTAKEEANLFTCPFCKEEKVNTRHICEGKLAAVKFFCENCGALGVEEIDICNPKPIAEIDPEIKAAWESAKKQKSGKKLHDCKVCGQPVEPPGHYCDRIVPFTCQYCGQKVESNYHLCKGMMGKFKFICKNCGRLGIKKTDICAPEDL